MSITVSGSRSTSRWKNALASSRALSSASASSRVSVIASGGSTADKRLPLCGRVVARVILLGQGAAGTSDGDARSPTLVVSRHHEDLSGQRELAPLLLELSP